MALLNDVFEAMKVEETFVCATAVRGTLIPSCSAKTGLTGRNFIRCNSNTRIEIGTRRDCQSLYAPPFASPGLERAKLYDNCTMDRLV
jgi:hypothetical protein